VPSKTGLKTSPLDYLWMNIGDAGFSESYAYHENLAFNQSGQPYVAYVSEWDSVKVSVMKFDELHGNMWA